ncbi:hypothetical protein GJ496_005168 [Pomphorhynchus laevis]|nr:hypothetical protein GJ496_005168 [Pomphorhynchus laevis]
MRLLGMMWPEIEECSNRYELKLSGKRISDRLKHESDVLPQALFDLTHLNHLEISAVDLTYIENEQLLEFPNDISPLCKLKHLDISNNAITDFSNITIPQSLETLTTTHNDIAIFELISNPLDCLTTIDASFCKINKFIVDNASILRQINLKGNRLNSVPSCLSNLPNLKIVDISNNNISELCPNVILKCTRLRYLSASDNAITDNRLRKLLDQNAKTRTIMDHLISKKGKETNVSLTSPKTKDSCSEINVDQSTTDLTKVFVIKPGTISVLQNLEAKQSGYHLICCILRDVDLITNGKFENLIKEQIRLHKDCFDQRNDATLATHDLDKVCTDSLLFRVTSLDQVNITPLGNNKSICAKSLYDELRAESERKRKEKKKSRILALHKYLDIITIEEKVAHLSDSQRTISLHPLTNCEDTKLLKTTKNVLLEVCSVVSLEKARNAMDTTIDAFIRLQCWPNSSESVIEQIKILNEDDKSLKYVYPSRTDLANLHVTFL